MQTRMSSKLVAREMELRVIEVFVDKVEDFFEGEATTDVNAINDIHSTFFSFHHSDQATVVSKLKGVVRERFVRMVIVDIDAEILFHLDRAVLYDFVRIVERVNFSKMLSMLEVQDAVQIIAEFDKDLIKDIINLIPIKKRLRIKQLLSYPKDSVGRIMNMNYFSVLKTYDVHRVMEYINFKNKTNRDNTTGEIFIVDDSDKVIGKMSIIDLLKLKQTEIIGNFSKKITKYLGIYDSIDDAVQMVVQYDLSVIPVIDEDSKLVGVIEVASIADLINEKLERDLLSIGGVFQSKGEGLFSIAKTRCIWLFINLLTAVFASTFIGMFEDVISSFATLAVLLPITASMGGNCGTQTSTVIVRAIATRDFDRDLMVREVLVAMMNGLIFGFISFISVLMIYHNLKLALAFSIAMIITLCLAGLAGVFIPTIVKKVKLDPAIVSTIFLTTVTDVSGFFSFLGLSKLILF